MLFNSISFLIFFPIVALLYYIIPQRFRYLWLLFASYYFYMSWNPKYALLLLGTTIITYLGGRLLALGKHRKFLVGLCFFANLAILFHFKYLDFVVECINRVFSGLNLSMTIPAFDILLPVGISFYIFQALSYIMDIYRGEIKAEQNFFKYALFVSFFPQLVAGPIERSKNLIPQIDEKHTFDYNQVKSGMLLMLWGFFLKLIIADRIALFVDAVYGDYHKFPGTYLIIATVLFAFQIYCDFYGYSTIAIGAAKVMGFHLMENFDCPYFAKSVSDFWRRWHISLTGWFKDYLYIPLGGNRKGKWRKFLNIMIVFCASGIWHGANFTYLIWGGINGLFQVIGELTINLRTRINSIFKMKPNSLSHRLLRTLCTFFLIDFSWIFFRANSFTDAKNIIYSMLKIHNPWILINEDIYSAGLSRQDFSILLIALFVLLIADYFKYKKISLQSILAKQELWFRWLLYLLAVGVILIFGIWGTAYDSNAFIYFQF